MKPLLRRKPSKYTGKRKNPAIQIDVHVDSDRYDGIMDRYYIIITADNPEAYVQSNGISDCNSGKGKCDEIICIEECRKGVIKRPLQTKRLCFDLPIYQHERGK